MCRGEAIGVYRGAVIAGAVDVAWCFLAHGEHAVAGIQSISKGSSVISTKGEVRWLSSAVQKGSTLMLTVEGIDEMGQLRGP